MSDDDSDYAVTVGSFSIFFFSFFEIDPEDRAARRVSISNLGATTPHEIKPEV